MAKGRWTLTFNERGNNWQLTDPEGNNPLPKRLTSLSIHLAMDDAPRFICNGILIGETMPRKPGNFETK